MKEKIHIAQNRELVGSCCPCSFINLLDLDGSSKLEGELSELGKIKPFQGGDFTSFLIWGEKYNVNLEVYVEEKELTRDIIKKMIEIEILYKLIKVNSKEDEEKLGNAAYNYHASLVEKYKKQIKILKEKPLKMIKKLIMGGSVVAFAMTNSYEGGTKLIPHMRVCYKIERDIFFIKDSNLGIIKLTSKQMQKDIDNNKLVNYPNEIIAFNKHF